MKKGRLLFFFTPLALVLTPALAHAALAPAQPTSVSATAADGSVNLSWSAPGDNGGSAVTGYTVQYAPHDAASSYTSLASLGKTVVDNGEEPYSSLLYANGLYYGTTSGGGAHGDGTIFSYSTTTSTFTVLYDFDSTHGASPGSGLTLGSDGLLYGTATEGGAHSDGVLFSYSTTTSTYTDLHDFDGTHGNLPYSAPTLGNDGLLYGTATQGGANTHGVLYSFDPSTGIYTDLYDFDGTHGAGPEDTLVLGSGLLYGTASTGGANGHGSIFSYSTTTSTFTDLHDFTGSNTYYSDNVHLSSRGGVLYGATAGGGTHDDGTLFSYATTTSTFTDLYDFDGSPNDNPYVAPTLGNDGLLYGVAGGGAHNNGVLYSYSTTTSTFTDLYDFDGTHGAAPYAAVTEGSDGLLYGTATEGGANGDGVIFSYSTTTSTYTDLYDFGSVQTTGALPYYGTLLPYHGVLYGTTSSGGANSYGTIFSVDTDGNVTDVYSFDSTHGRYPYSSPTLGSDGLLYGTTAEGGANGYGVLYSFDPSTGVYADLYDFDDTHGATPYASPTLGSDGLLYGTTPYGGAHGYGVLYSFDPSTDTYTDLHDFYSSSDGYAEYAYASPTLGSDGILYGTTYEGGANLYGTLYSFDPSTDTYTDLHDFYSSSDNYADFLTASPILGSDGILYGTTYGGGANDSGVLYSFDPSTDTYTDLYDFYSSGDDYAEYAYASPALGDDGLLYGTTVEGGANNRGIFYSFDPSTDILTDLNDLCATDTDGCYGYYRVVEYGGTYYSTTYEGGTYDAGTIFSYGKNWSTSPDSGTGTSATVTGLTDGVTYDFRIQAVNSVGDGDYSDVVSATPAVPPPPSSSSSSSGNSGDVGLILILPGGIGGTPNPLPGSSASTPTSGTSPSTSSTPSSGGSSYHFTSNLSLWSTGKAILSLQEFLNTHGFPLGVTGAGSPGHETESFGPRTYTALVKFQKAHDLPATGFFGSLTRAVIAVMSATSTGK